MSEQQTERLAGMLRWLLENPGCVNDICGWDGASVWDMEETLDWLEQQGYYEYILLLLVRETESTEMERAVADYVANRLTHFLRENGPKVELSVFRAILSEHLAQKRAAKG